MNFQQIVLFSVVSSALAAGYGNSLTAQHEKSGQEWTEAINDFKNLVHVITFGEEIPSHHSNPLQLLIQEADYEATKNPFKLPDGWFGIEINDNSQSRQHNGNKFSSKKKMSRIKKNEKHYKPKSNKKGKFINVKSKTPSEFRESQSFDDLALLDFLVKLEEPNHRAKVTTPQNKKHLESLLMAEDRYNEIKKRINRSQKFKTEKFKAPIFKSNQIKAKPAAKKKKEDKWYERLDTKSARNKITLSVAFAVIVTALFCVIVQLFKLFVKPKNITSTFEQINRRSTHGYDRIALDVEEDEESTPLN